MSFRVLRCAAGLSLLSLAAACGQAVAGGAVGGGAGPAGSGSRSVAGDEVVVQVRYLGGFVEPASLATRLPIVSVYADGRVITEGPVPAIYPGQALPNVQVQRISTQDVNRLVAKAMAAGVGHVGDLGRPPIADAATTRFMVLTDAGTSVTEVYALSEAGEDQAGLDAAQRRARAKLRDLLATLTDLPKALGAGAVSESKPYTPTGLVAVASRWTDPGDNMTPTRPDLAWPGPLLPGEPVSTGPDLGCVAMDGEQAAQVLAAARGATTITPWISGGSRWTVRFRPLLPDETGCAAI
jgi:hypothetical protein